MDAENGLTADFQKPRGGAIKRESKSANNLRNPGGQGLDIHLSYLDHGVFREEGALPVTGSRPVFRGVVGSEIGEASPYAAALLAVAVMILFGLARISTGSRRLES